MQNILRHPRAYVIAGTAALSLCALIAVVSGSRKEVRAESRSSFWQELQISGDEVEGYDSLSEMSRAADIVVRGRLRNFRMSRQIQGDAHEDVVSYAAADLAVTERIRGAMVSGTLPVEFLLDETPERAVEVVAELASMIPSEDIVVFLRKKRGRSDQGYYRVVNSSGLWTATPAGLIAPLSPAEETEDVAASVSIPTTRSASRRSPNAAVTAPAAAVRDARDRRAQSTPGHPEHASEAAHSRYASELAGVSTLEQLARKLKP